MAAVTTEILTSLDYAGNCAMDPCGKCGLGVSEICDFRFNIYEKDLHSTHLITKFINIPLHCPCVNIDELNLIKPLDILITRRVLWFCLSYFDKMEIRDILSRYIIFMNNDIVNNYLEEYLEEYAEEYAEEHAEDKDIIDGIKLFREIYEEFTNVNLKPAKR
jgi:hypothetical protein